MSITSKNSLPNIADHEQKALAVLNQQRFAISPAIQSNLGFDTSLLGLARPDSKALDHSVTAAQLAVALSDTDPVLNFNLAAALLAHRQLSQALLSYKQATNLVGRGQADLIGGAITDLHVVLRYCRGVNPEPYCRQLETILSLNRMKPPRNGSCESPHLTFWGKRPRHLLRKPPAPTPKSQESDMQDIATAILPCWPRAGLLITALLMSD